MIKEKAPAGYRYFHIIAILFVASLLIGNTVAVKIISVAGFAIPAGILCFPVAYIVNDVLTEVYGYDKAKGVIWWAFISLAFMTLIYYLATIIKPAVFWEFQDSFEKIFSFTPRIALGSLVAFLIGSLLNSIVLSKMKVAMKGKKLWIRTNVSTIIGEGADSLIFNVIAFAGIFAGKDLIGIIITGWIMKSLYEFIATPLTIKIVGYLKKKEEIDIYDTDTDYKFI